MRAHVEVVWDGKSVEMQYTQVMNRIILYHGSPNETINPEYGLGDDRHDYGKEMGRVSISLKASIWQRNGLYADQTRQMGGFTSLNWTLAD